MKLFLNYWLLTQGTSCLELGRAPSFLLFLGGKDAKGGWACCTCSYIAHELFLLRHHFCFLYLKCWNEMEARLAGPSPSPDSDREKKFQQGTV